MSKYLLTDPEVKEEFARYYTEEDMMMPEPYFTIASGIIAIVRKAQHAKTVRMLFERIEQEKLSINCVGRSVVIGIDEDTLQSIKQEILKEVE